MSNVKLTSRIPRLRKEVRDRASQLVRSTALQVEAQAKILAPVDTGFLRNSITTTAGRDAQGKFMNGLTAIVSVGAEYGIFVELGTVHRGPHPFLVPAFELTRPKFEAAIKALSKLR